MDGMMKMETLYLKGKDASYKINRDAKTYSVIPPPKEDPNNKVDIKVTKTGETAKVLDYPCTKYIVDVTVEGAYAYTTLCGQRRPLRNLI